MVYLVCTCRQLEGTCWWEDRGPAQTLDWRQGYDKTGDPDILTALSARLRKHGDHCNLLCDVFSKTPISMYSHCGSVYLDSDRRSAFCVLLHSYVWVCRRAQVLIRNMSSVESWQDAHSRPGRALNDECVSFTSVSCVVLQDGVKINLKTKHKLISLSLILLTEIV